MVEKEADGREAIHGFEGRLQGGKRAAHAVAHVRLRRENYCIELSCRLVPFVLASLLTCPPHSSTSPQSTLCKHAIDDESLAHTVVARMAVTVLIIDTVQIPSDEAGEAADASTV
jgi:hypothetical protein